PRRSITRHLRRTHRWRGKSPGSHKRATRTHDDRRRDAVELHVVKSLRELLFPVIAILAAFVVGGLLVALIGDDPILTYRLLIGSALSWPDGIGYTLFYATPLVFTGLAVAVGFRCGLLNIGAEGQLTMAAFATALAGIVFANASPWILIPITCVV